MSVQITPAIKKLIQDETDKSIQTRMERMAKINEDSSAKAAAISIFKTAFRMRNDFFGRRDLKGFAITDITVDFIREKYLSDVSDEELMNI